MAAVSNIHSRFYNALEMTPPKTKWELFSKDSFLELTLYHVLIGKHTEMLDTSIGTLVTVVHNFKSHPACLDSPNRTLHLYLCQVAYHTFPTKWMTEGFPDFFSKEQLLEFLVRLKDIPPSMQRFLGEFSSTIKEIDAKDLDLLHFLCNHALIAQKKLISSFNKPEQGYSLPEVFWLSKKAIYPYPILLSWLERNPRINRCYDATKDKASENEFFSYLIHYTSLALTMINRCAVTRDILLRKFLWIQMCYVPGVFNEELFQENKEEIENFRIQVSCHSTPPKVSIESACTSQKDVFVVMGPKIFAIPNLSLIRTRAEQIMNFMLLMSERLASHPTAGHQAQIAGIKREILSSRLPFNKTLKEHCSRFFTRLHSEHYKKFPPPFSLNYAISQEKALASIQALLDAEVSLSFEELTNRIIEITYSLTLFTSVQTDGSLPTVPSEDDLKKHISEVLENALDSEAWYYYYSFRFSHPYDKFPLTLEAAAALSHFSASTIDVYSTIYIDRHARIPGVSFPPSLQVKSQGQTHVIFSRQSTPAEALIDYLLERIMFDENKIHSLASHALDQLITVCKKEFPFFLLDLNYARKAFQRYKLKRRRTENTIVPFLPPTCIPIKFPKLPSTSSIIRREAYIPLSYRPLDEFLIEEGVTAIIDLFPPDSPIERNLAMEIERNNPLMKPLIDNVDEDSFSLRLGQALFLVLPYRWFNKNTRPEQVTADLILQFRDALLITPETMKSHLNKAIKRIFSKEFKSFDFPTALFLFNCALHNLDAWQERFPFLNVFLKRNGNILPFDAIKMAYENADFLGKNNTEQIAFDFHLVYSFFQNTSISSTFFLHKICQYFLIKNDLNFAPYINSQELTYVLNIKRLDQNIEIRMDDCLQKHIDLLKMLGIRIYAFNNSLPMPPKALEVIKLNSIVSHRTVQNLLERELHSFNLPLHDAFQTSFQNKVKKLLESITKKSEKIIFPTEDAANLFFHKFFKIKVRELELTLPKLINDKILEKPQLPLETAISQGLAHFSFIDSNIYAFISLYEKKMQATINLLENKLKIYSSQNKIASWKQILTELYKALRELKYSKAECQKMKLALMPLKEKFSHFPSSDGVILALKELLNEAMVTNIINLKSAISKLPNIHLEIINCFREACSIQAKEYYLTAWFSPNYYRQYFPHETLIQREIRYYLLDFLTKHDGLIYFEDAIAFATKTFTEKNPELIFDLDFAERLLRKYAEENRMSFEIRSVSLPSMSSELTIPSSAASLPSTTSGMISSSIPSMSSETFTPPVSSMTSSTSTTMSPATTSISVSQMSSITSSASAASMYSREFSTPLRSSSISSQGPTLSSAPVHEITVGLPIHLRSPVPTSPIAIARPLARHPSSIDLHKLSIMSAEDNVSEFGIETPPFALSRARSSASPPQDLRSRSLRRFPSALNLHSLSRRRPGDLDDISEFEGLSLEPTPFALSMGRPSTPRPFDLPSDDAKETSSSRIRREPIGPENESKLPI